MSCASALLFTSLLAAWLVDAYPTLFFPQWSLKLITAAITDHHLSCPSMVRRVAVMDKSVSYNFTQKKFMDLSQVPAPEELAENLESQYLCLHAR